MKTKYHVIAVIWMVTTLLFTACGGGSSSPAGYAGKTPTYTLSGQFQKGPFAIGSQISVNELNESLNPTGQVYNVQTSDDLGNFTVGSDIGTHLVEIIGSGFYMDELTGNLASSQVQIRAVVDLAVDSTPTVNILTALQSRRLKKLITQGSTYAAANTQSRNEVLTAFGIDPGKVNSLTTLYSMQINGSTDADSVLLAVSTILSKMASNAAAANGTTQPAELSNYVNTIAAQVENTGTISAAIITAKNLAATQIDFAAVRTNVESYYANRGITIVAPKFEEWVDKDGSGILPRRLVPAAGLSFTDQSGVEPNQIITSNLVTVDGLGAGNAAPVATNAGTTIIKNDTALPGIFTTAKDGDTLGLRVTSLGYGLTSSATITVGTSSATWRVTSKPLGGTIRMLSGTGLVLQNNGADNITIPAGSSSFNFNAPMANNTAYNVSVLTQPTSPAQVCTVANASGTVGAAVSNVIVSCAGPLSSLAYTDVTGVDPNQAITSNAVTVSGLGADIIADVTVDADTTIIKNGTAVPGTTTTAIDGDSIAMRITSLGYGLTNSSTIVIASSSATWRVTSKPLGGIISGLTSTGLVLQNNGTDNITIPAGSTDFTFSAPVANGASYNVTVLTQPTYPPQVCDVTNGTGTVGAALSNISVACSAVSGFAYVTDLSGITAYTITAATGALTSIGRFTTGEQPQPVTVDPTGTFAYAANRISGTISAFTITAGTGMLSNIGTIATVEYPAPVTVDPTGKFAYVSGGAGAGKPALSAYTINAATGALTAVVGSTFTSDYSTSPVTVDPTGNFAYAANINGRDTVSAFAIDAATGALTLTGTVEAGIWPASGPGIWPYFVLVHRTGKFAYVVNVASNDISAYTINAGTGALTSLGTIASGGLGSNYAVVDPTGKFLYVKNQTSCTISAYTINGTTGTLTAVAGSPFAVEGGGNLSVITVDPTGKFFYAVNSNANNISAYTINAATGALTAVAGSPFAAGTQPASFTFDPTGKFAYVANNLSNDVSAYTINATTGALTSIGTFAAGSGASSVTTTIVR